MASRRKTMDLECEDCKTRTSGFRCKSCLDMLSEIKVLGNHRFVSYGPSSVDMMSKPMLVALLQESRSLNEAQLANRKKIREEVVTPTTTRLIIKFYRQRGDEEQLTLILPTVVCQTIQIGHKLSSNLNIHPNADDIANNGNLYQLGNYFEGTVKEILHNFDPPFDDRTEFEHVMYVHLIEVVGGWS